MTDRRRQTKSSKPQPRDESAKPLFEMNTWARDDHSMDRVGSSVHMYTFVKDGQSKGERCPEHCCISSGQTFRVALKDFMFEEKVKGESVFPSNVEVIEPFSAVEIMISPSHHDSFVEGYAFNVSRVRPCDFSLYSLNVSLGLRLLKPSYIATIEDVDLNLRLFPGLARVMESKNTAFFAQARQGAYLVPFKDAGFRLVGPHENPAEASSRHLSVMQGGDDDLIAVDIPRDVLHRFTNACEVDQESSDSYARFVVDLASSAGALSLYVVHNDFRLRADQDRSPYVAVPIIDTAKLLEFVTPTHLTTTISLPFPMPSLQNPHVIISAEPVISESQGGVPRFCQDLVISSESAPVSRAYPLTYGDEIDEEIMTVLFSPKTRASGSSFERPDYRSFKKRREG